MALDYARKQTHSRLRRTEKNRAVRTTVILGFAVLFFMAVFGFLGLNLFTRMSLLLTRLRSSKPTPVTETAIPPTTPQLCAPPEATASAIIDISGFGQPDSQVTLFLNGTQTTDTTVNPDGSFLFPGITLADGLNSFYAVASDGQGTDSAHSATITVVVDTTAPTLDITTPIDGAIFYGAAERLVKLSGQTDPDTNLTINDQVILVMSDGSFTSQFELKEGSNLLTFKALDKAGNLNQKDLNLTYNP